MSFLADFCSFKFLTRELIEICHPFNCDDEDLREFFASDFVQYQNDLFGKTYCFTLDENPRQIVCAFTISNDSIRANLISKTDKNRLSRRISNQKRGLKSYPAVLIGRLGVSMDFEGRGI
ncbi:MAG: N-acetyltransferase, partial [Crocinitomicaceae bacterium]